MRNAWRRKARPAVVASGLAVAMALAAAAQAQNGTVPDAQVESNVIRQLATAPDLATQNIQTNTIYGTVTLTGNVHDEAMRTEAENLAARAQGVKKVVDELTLGDTPAPQPAGADQNGQTADTSAQGDPNAQTAAQGAPPPGEVLQSDGTYAPANSAQSNVPDAGQSTSSVQPGAPGTPEYGGQAQPYAGQQTQQQAAPQQAYPQGQSYPQGQGYSQGQSYPQGQGYPQQAYNNAPPPGYGPGPRQPMYPNGYAPGPQGQRAPMGGQVGGQQVVVAPGSVLRVRLDRGFDANHVKPGTPFSGIVMQDILADGAIAIPRGAAVQGTVVDAKKAGVLKGEAQLGLDITGLTLGGQEYVLTTDVWQREGRDKTVGTVNSALGLGALGAIIGGVAGGGGGAAIGAAAGGAAGVAGSAASPGGRVIVPPEAVLTFRLAQPVQVITVGQAELSRLSYAAGPAQRPMPPPRRYYYGPYGYYGPGYYR